MQKYTFRLTLATAEQLESRKKVLARGPSETVRHLALKLLGYILYFDRDPAIEVGVGQPYKPDLVCTDGDAVTLWVDCGTVNVDKMDAVLRRNPKAEVTVVKMNRRQTGAYAALARKKLRTPERLRLAAFDDDFVPAFVHALETRCDLTIRDWRPTERLEIAVDDLVLRTAVYWQDCGTSF